MTYRIANHVIKYPVTRVPNWTVLGNGEITIAYEYADNAKIKCAKCASEYPVNINPDHVAYNMDRFGKDLMCAPAIKKRVFTHDGDTFYPDSKFVWRITIESGECFDFNAEDVGWVLHRLRGKKLKWRAMEYQTEYGLLGIFGREDSTLYSIVTGIKLT